MRSRRNESRGWAIRCRVRCRAIPAYGIRGDRSRDADLYRPKSSSWLGLARLFHRLPRSSLRPPPLHLRQQRQLLRRGRRGRDARETLLPVATDFSSRSAPSPSMPSHCEASAQPAAPMLPLPIVQHVDGAAPAPHMPSSKRHMQQYSSLASSFAHHLDRTREPPMNPMNSSRRPSRPLPPPQTPASGLDISEMETGLLVHRPVAPRIPDQETALLHPVPPDVSAIRNRFFSGEMPAVASEDIAHEHLREAAALRERAAALQANIQRQASLIQRDMVQREQLQRLGPALGQAERARPRRPHRHPAAARSASRNDARGRASVSRAGSRPRGRRQAPVPRLSRASLVARLTTRRAARWVRSLRPRPLPAPAACGTIHRRRPPPPSLATRNQMICVQLAKSQKAATHAEDRCVRAHPASRVSRAAGAAAREDHGAEPARLLPRGRLLPSIRC